MKIRNLAEEDRDQVERLDELSGFCLEQWLDDEGYGYGIFVGKELIGYCSIGYADDICATIEKYPEKTPDSLLLSDVYVIPTYRNKGYGTQLIAEAISLRHQYDGHEEIVFCEPIHEGLIKFYGNLGFTEIGEMCMVK